MPEGVSVLNLNVPRGATTRIELRRTVQSQQPYYVRRGPGSARPLGQPYQFPVEVVIDWDRLEPGTDIHAIVRDQVASVTPLTWQMTARTDWIPPGDGQEA
jgi:5'-nucleotidase